ncbi:2-amino-4-hydroxy-6-hydroxymethyldihydropteridinediphosphokinase [Paracoccus homiensis]|uniref:2-amino-4-hydroxy-6-hydroxymethyldihydropteridine pyrophosphokinase n=1 Tax=Paracoccus homiensis TaxID=364199 RepID=A0A1H9YFF4_9RHOB|nr:2-amino-4-hydroxy-6-hydroxymethyldihydropteridinediphosphokinase [Paracoccus homiensis]
MSFCIIALGANLPSASGSAKETLRASVGILHAELDISICRISDLWETPAVPAGAGPDFANAALTLTTDLAASDLLQLLHRIEAQAGRDRTTGRWSARVLDLDLIAVDDQIHPDRATLQDWIDLPFDDQQQRIPDRLILPHPRMQDRGFVLAPLAQIAPDWRHPVTGHSVSRMLADLPADQVAGMRRDPGFDLDNRPDYQH